MKQDTDSATISLENTVPESKNDSLPKKERLESVVDYNSDDQIHERENKMTYLLRKANVTYKDMNIAADYIEINWDTGDVFADGKRDSLGLVVEPTIFKQGNQEFEQQSFTFNFNTQKGTAFGVRFDDDTSGGVMLGEKVTRLNDTISYVSGIKYTTDTYFKDRKTKDPDYYIQAKEGKILDQKQNKTVIARNIIMKIHDVPTPIALPFVFLPMSDKRKAGILIPSFGEREELGFFLTGLGFYLPLGEYVDLALTTDFYTRGSWGIHTQSTYKKRYRFNGNFRFDYERLLQGTKGLDDYAEQKLFRLNWTHTKDPKSNPNLSFTASVNYATSEYFRNTILNQNIFNNSFLTNNINSSISLTKNFDNSPFSMSLNLNHSQVNNQSSNEPARVTMNLPQFTLNMSRIYPFAGKSGSKKGLVKNFNINYNLNIQNLINTNEDDVFTSAMWDQARNGARHQMNMNTGFTIGNYFPINFTSSYNEVWYLQTTKIGYNQTEDIVQETEVNGFDSYRTFNIGANVQTNLYGTFISKKEDAFIKGIRHVVSPTIGFGFTPDFANEFWGYYDTYRDADGTKVLYNRFQDGIYGGPSRGLQTNLTFALNNNLEMKVRSRQDSTGFKKIKIFEFLNFNTSYNLAADSLKLSPIQMTGATSLLDSKLRINFNARFDPYRVVFANEEASTGTRVDQFAGIRLDSYNVNLNYGFDNNTFSGDNKDQNKNAQYKKRGAVRQEDYYFDEDNYARFSVPWTARIGVNHTYTLGANREATRRLSLTMNGSIQPAPHWDIRFNTSYDFEADRFSATNFTFARDLRSFNINFTWQPFGQFKTWNFFIGIRSSILADALKYEDNASNELRGLF